MAKFPQTFWLCALVLLSWHGFGCSDRPLQGESLELKINNNHIDLAERLPGQWDRVCVLGPYTDNSGAAKVLGFAVEIETTTHITNHDDIALLVTSQGQTVVNLWEISRANVDVSSLAGECYDRAHTKLRVSAAGVVPAKLN